ncbi:MAG: hypothetical protein EOP07_12075 [Proteobacteria bacterium]|nr:MAG: hypothetical protein EOP07_12075 [Pseudomonadota bacterium]
MKLTDGPSAFFISFVVIVGAIWMIRRNEVVLPPPSEVIDVGRPVSTAKEKIIVAPAENPSEKSRDAARKNYNLMVLNGITKVPAPIRNKKIRLSILPRPEAQWCKSGDFDLIKAIATNTKDKLITLSVESLKKGGVRKSQSFSLAEMTGKKAANFELPLTDGAYGLFLCTDQSKKGACGRKAAINPRIWSAGPAQIKKLAQDKVFYFQLLHVKDGSLNIIPSDSWGKANLAQLKERLGDWMGEDVDALEKMDALISKLQPMPARLADSKIEIPLPYNDLRCVSH